MELRSTAFTDHTPIPERYTRDGDNTSPPLEWSGVPDEAAELVLICEDPDAPRGTFVHWLIAGLPPTPVVLEAGKLPPEAVLGRNDFGDTAWDGPQPPIGDPAHRYFFRLYALRRPTGLEHGFAAEELRRRIQADTVDSGTLVGLYQR
jgi:Raf kinase inhibitor-like YbhB/YbcL family protein